MSDLRTKTHVGDGPLAVEASLLESLAAACTQPLTGPEALAAPLRVVVPSEALRTHLTCQLLARIGRPVLGLEIQTSAAAARELLERAGNRPVDALLAGIAVRSAAREEPDLVRELGDLDDGYAAVVIAVDDLLDAGFTAAHAEPLAERLGEEPLGAERRRAEALLRVALATARELEADTLGHRSLLYVRATDRLRDEGAKALPSRRVWLHGFADATGVQLDWLEALRSVLGAALWLDLPAPGQWRFGARLRERLGEGQGAAMRRGESAVAKSTHTDREDEARAAARWARDRIDEGMPAARIGIVARDLATHRLALRRQLGRHGVPWSGAGERGGALPLARRLEACWSLIERGAALPVERWLEARADLGLAERADLRDACAALGVTRLGELARLDEALLGESRGLAAPTALAAGRDGEPRTRRRLVSSSRLRALRGRAFGALRRLESWPAEAPLVERLAALAELGEALGWDDTGAERAALAEAFPEPEQAGPRPVPRSDWPRLLRRCLAHAGTDALGGRGGGVQVLNATEARSQTFEALWLLGMERGVFPRRISEDPLLPDALRVALRAVLPDLPVKGEGRDEERFLFAQLASSSPLLRVSRALRDERGRSVQASPLFEALTARSIEEPRAEAARLEAEPTLAAALAAARAEAGLAPVDCAPVARARLAVVREFESRRRALGPYLGALGPARTELDPRRAAPHVTLLERLASCPWQTFLQRVLRVAPPSDPHGPLPEASDRRRLGNVVHAALEALGDPARSESPWPGAAPGDWLERAASKVLEDEGIAMVGYAVALARRAAPFVEVARRLDAVSDWQRVAVEVREVATVADASGAPRRVRFKADREDLRDGVRRFTDWKTGKLKLDQRKPGARSEALRKKIAAGEFLQGHTYASAGAVGRYLFLDPEADDALRAVEVENEGPQREAYERALGVLFAALEAGSLPPRLRKPDRDEEPGSCRRCDVKQACQRGDSGVRARLAGWADRADDRDDLDRAGLALWGLGGEP